ncbi:phospholipase A1 1 [Euwallacea similis]|uniref:phospholipase A1 1 n=1 Tax=Euwallacea similis TaxID=1736056 RepID=UPI00344E89C8
MTKQRGVFCIVKRESAVFICYYLVFITFTGIYGQQTKDKEEPQSVQELFNTSSCIPKPFRCPHKQIQFFLYTRRTQENPELLDTTKEESLYESQFNRRYPVKIVVHGFGGGRNLSPSTDMRDAYFYRGNYNIIIVDYGTLVKEPCLSQMEWAPRFCAKCIAQLIRYLTQHPRGVRADDLHLVGYSVGAHISGLVANYIDPQRDGKLGRITGLDPTIFFYMGRNSSRDLDSTDAHFVDVLHTGAGILGQWGPNGHADFYINGGSSQPGCGSDTVFKTLACDHTKVTPYFIESIISKKGFWAYPCPTLISFMLNWCSPQDEDYVLMGEHVSHKARGVYYVRTYADPPWAQGPPLEIKQRLAKRTLPILQRLARNGGDSR